MKTKYLIAAGILALSGAVLITSCRPQRGMCHRFPDRFIAGKVAEIERDLKLTDAQKTQFREIRKRVKDDAVAHMQAKNRLAGEIAEKLNATNPNVEEIVASIRSHMKSEQGKMTQKLDYITEFYGILNADQKRILNQKVREHIAEKNRKMDGFIDHLKGVEL